MPIRLSFVGSTSWTRSLLISYLENDDLGDGDYFGEMAILSDVSRNATIRVVAPTEVLVIPKDVFDLLKTNVPAFRDVFQSLARQRPCQAPSYNHRCHVLCRRRGWTRQIREIA